MYTQGAFQVAVSVLCLGLSYHPLALPEMSLIGLQSQIWALCLPSVGLLPWGCLSYSLVPLLLCVGDVPPLCDQSCQRWGF